jgi:hypothetical protein
MPIFNSRFRISKKIGLPLAGILLSSVVTHVDAQPPTMIGLGESKSGFHQLHKQSIEGAGTNAPSGWVWTTLSPDSGVADKAKALAVMYIASCTANTVYPIIWNAYGEDGKKVADGTHGQYMKRTVQPGTIDAEIYKNLCPKK